MRPGVPDPLGGDVGEGDGDVAERGDHPGHSVPPALPDRVGYLVAGHGPERELAARRRARPAAFGHAVTPARAAWSADRIASAGAATPVKCSNWPSAWAWSRSSPDRMRQPAQRAASASGVGHGS